LALEEHVQQSFRVTSIFDMVKEVGAYIVCSFAIGVFPIQR
jgi:hypothetical protein